MFLASFRLKTAVQKWLYDTRMMWRFPDLHPGQELSERALRDSCDYIEQNMPAAIGLPTAREVLDVAMQGLPDGQVAEFGVYRGGTINYIAKRLRDRTVHGFDSFQGLPEAWSGGSNNSQAGMFSTGGKLPSVRNNVRLHVGLFTESLPRWLAEHSGPMALVHIDCDLYSSTKSIFSHLVDRFVPGTVIVFDEYFNYPNWRQHEFRAFQELVAERRLKYEYVAYARIQVCVRITAIGD